MRLTLRTLLAYLDNTLEPQDAEVLRAKLTESGFATQLVQRIRASLVNPNLAAPDPSAAAPIEDANAMCEYLDSTLSAEQVAEIERACLESETHLAEVAACHQILTMVLGQPAEVSQQLRRRVYELPDRELKDIPTSGSFSSLAIPGDQSNAFGSDLPTADAPITGNDDIPTLDQPLTAAGETVHPGEPVTPVGPADSGVSDAPTRLRQAGSISGSDPAIAGERSAGTIGRSDMYGGSIRPSRITPWLVSLALAAVLLFALAQIFSPLLRNRTAKLDSDAITTDEIVVAPENAPPMVVVETVPSDADSATTVESLPPPDAALIETAEPDPASPPAESSVAAKSAPETSEPGDGDATDSVDMSPAATETVDSLAPPIPAGLASEIGGANDPVMKPLPANDGNDAMPVPSESDLGDAPPVPGSADAETPSPDIDTAPAADPKAKRKVAKVLSESTLMVGRFKDGDWVRLKQNDTVGAGVSIACAPLFQGHMTSEAGVDIMLVGATNVAWETGSLDATLSIENGRVLIGSLEPDVAIGLRLGDANLELRFADPEAVIAIIRSHFRAPGFDPLRDENHLPTSTILAVQGDTELVLDGAATTLSTGDQWTMRGAGPAAVEASEEPPAWIENPDAEQEEVYTLARDTLLELIDSDQPIVTSLHEATMFRRSEVAALAGRSLLTMGIGDVYFGGDGLLSQVNQRNYWPDHYRALMQAVNRGAEGASKLFADVQAMESADADVIIRLLVGYSQKQLVEGSDEQLVKFLDSNSMAVRVLARENLRTITGLSLNFKAEQNNPVRRAPEIKKWAVRLRKGDIRWQPQS
tara:strand:- start:328609 stop:331059 length:2451 start_codon:yes stop_codon:yes gene_type:complete